MFITQYQIYEDLLLQVIQSVRILLRLLILQSAKFSTQVLEYELVLHDSNDTDLSMNDYIRSYTGTCRYM